MQGLTRSYRDQPLSIRRGILPTRVNGWIVSEGMDSEPFSTDQPEVEIRGERNARRRNHVVIEHFVRLSASCVPKTLWSKGKIRASHSSCNE